MNRALQILGISVLTLLVLTITVKNKTVFEHIYSVLSFATIPTQNLAESLFQDGMDSTKKYSQKLFSNSVPKVRDSVKSKAAAPTRSLSGSGAPKEVILKEEKEELDELIKSHH